MIRQSLRVSIILRERGQVKAIADVTVPTDYGEITLPGWKVIQPLGGEPWVAAPSKSIGNNGKTSYQKVVDMAQVTHRVIADAVLSEYRRLLNDSEASSRLQGFDGWKGQTADWPVRLGGQSFPFQPEP